MDKTKKQIIILWFKILLMTISLLLLPVWVAFYYLIGIPAVILAEILENITGVYLMNEIMIGFGIPLFYWLFLVIKNNDDNSEGDILFRNLQMVILTFLLSFSIFHVYGSNEDFYTQYFSILLPTFIVLVLGNRREIKRLLN